MRSGFAVLELHPKIFLSTGATVRQRKQERQQTAT